MQNPTNLMEEYEISEVHSKLGTLERGNIFSFKYTCIYKTKYWENLSGREITS